jgi:hypothetical protein
MTFKRDAVLDIICGEVISIDFFEASLAIYQHSKRG